VVSLSFQGDSPAIPTYELPVKVDPYGEGGSLRLVYEHTGFKTGHQVFAGTAGRILVLQRSRYVWASEHREARFHTWVTHCLCDSELKLIGDGGLPTSEGSQNALIVIGGTIQYGVSFLDRWVSIIEGEINIFANRVVIAVHIEGDGGIAINFEESCPPDRVFGVVLSKGKQEFVCSIWMMIDHRALQNQLCGRAFADSGW